MFGRESYSINMENTESSDLKLACGRVPYTTRKENDTLGNHPHSTVMLLFVLVAPSKEFFYILSRNVHLDVHEIAHHLARLDHVILSVRNHHEVKR